MKGTSKDFPLNVPIAFLPLNNLLKKCNAAFSSLRSLVKIWSIINCLSLKVATPIKKEECLQALKFQYQ